jgi:hypothetical protein
MGEQDIGPVARQRPQIAAPIPRRLLAPVTIAT